MDSESSYSKNYIYETEIIPDFMPVTVHFVDG